MSATIFLALALIAQPNTKPNTKADAPDSALTIEIIGGVPALEFDKVYAVYRVRNTSRVVLHRLMITHVYRDPTGKLVATERGSAVNAHIQPGKVSTVKILMKSIPSGDMYVDIQATANRKEVKISKKD